MEKEKRTEKQEGDKVDITEFRIFLKRERGKGPWRRTWVQNRIQTRAERLRNFGGNCVSALKW